MSRRSARQAAAARSREVQVAAAVAREAVLQLHTEHAQTLIRLGAGRVSQLRMLEIYIRLLNLGEATAEAVTTRVLAAMGRTSGGDTGELPRTLQHTEPVEEELPGRDDSLLRMLRQRLRGRVHDTLRRDVEIRAGVAKTALLHLHVTHAHRLVRLLADSHDIGSACALYTRIIEISPPHAGVLYMLVLDRLGAEEARAAWPAGAPKASPDARRLRRQALGDR